MAAKIKLTRPELKRQREILTRFNRYLPMLKLKQQQLQMAIRDVERARRAADEEERQADARIAPYRQITVLKSGVDLEALATPSEVKTGSYNIAGVALPVFEGCVFPPVRYSLFGTPAFVDGTLKDLRSQRACRAKAEVLREQNRLLNNELTKIIQRVNLFEKVKIPEAKEAIRKIRIRLGDEMTSAVGRGKIAKNKITGEAGS